MYRRFYISLSLISALVLLAYMLVAGYREVTPEWKKYQDEYKELFIKNAKDKDMRERAKSFDIEIQQIYLGILKRVDRCTICHIGVENPLMANAGIPYKQHSGEYLESHPVNKFGCTVCHYGQGRATKMKEAHGTGRDTHWDYPIIPLKYIQSSCAKCHDYKMLEQNGGEMVVKGEKLFREKGCKGCHKLNDVGGILGKALDGVGSQPIAYFPMSFVKGEKTVYSWLKQHFDDPRNIVPESQMKADITDIEADILTTYMLTLRAGEIPGEYRRIKYLQTGEETAVIGESLYKMYCIACHTTGKNSVNDKIFNRMIPAIMDPAFLRIANNRFLKRVIADGRTGTQMTAWKAGAAGLTDKEINRIVGYITKDRPAVTELSASGKIAAKKISEDIPSDPKNALWNRAQTFKVPLMLLSQKTDPNVKALYLETKRLNDPLERLINVKALYNDRDIAFWVEWKDDSRNVLLDVDIFRDGVALQFPAQNAAEPSFRMGQGQSMDNKGMVNIWFWKADAQESIDKKGTQPIPESPVENLIAGGFGTLTLKDRDSQQVSGKGKWKDKIWSVVFKRTFSGAKGSAEFNRGKLTPVSFAVWDGGENDVDGRKAVSAWYYVVPEG
jgi:DMSO reductase family type II enzyme heme b subunit